MNEQTEKYLSVILEGYEKSLEGVTEFINNNEQQLEGARKQRDEIAENVDELKEMLGISAEDETDETVLRIVEDAEEATEEA